MWVKSSSAVTKLRFKPGGSDCWILALSNNSYSNTNSAFLLSGFLRTILALNFQIQFLQGVVPSGTPPCYNILPSSDVSPILAEWEPLRSILCTFVGPFTLGLLNTKSPTPPKIIHKMLYRCAFPFRPGGRVYGFIRFSEWFIIHPLIQTRMSHCFGCLPFSLRAVLWLWHRQFIFIIPQPTKLCSLLALELNLLFHWAF